MKTIGLYEAKTKLSGLITELEETKEPILLTRHGKVVAQISLPCAQISPKRGCMKSSAFAIAEDFDQVDVGFEALEEDGLPSTRVAEDSHPYGSL